MKTRAFSLLEILATVSIVTILGAISVPVVNKMLDKGKEATCLGNGRQLGLTIARYAADNNNDINSMGQIVIESGEKTSWMVRARQYFEADAYADIRAKFICPAHPKFVKDNDAHVGWAFNTQLAPVENRLVRLNSVSQPSRTIYAAEGYRDFDWDSGDGHKAGFTVPKVFAKKNTMNAGERVFFPHSGKSVAIFIDGHAEMLTGPIPRELWVTQK